jgi:hypothetical protein
VPAVSGVERRGISPAPDNVLAIPERNAGVVCHMRADEETGRDCSGADDEQRRAPFRHAGDGAGPACFTFFFGERRGHRAFFDLHTPGAAQDVQSSLNEESRMWQFAGDSVVSSFGPLVARLARYGQHAACSRPRPEVHPARLRLLRHVVRALSDHAPVSAVRCREAAMPRRHPNRGRQWSGGGHRPHACRDRWEQSGGQANRPARSRVVRRVDRAA